MVDGHAALSPLRFHYDSEEFSLPIRLGLANSSGKQDLIVNISRADKRYEVANYKNVVHPDELRRQADGEGRGSASSTRRCSTRRSRRTRARSSPSTRGPRRRQLPLRSVPELDARRRRPDRRSAATSIGGAIAQGSFVLTRLHARYGKADMKDDLRFREAKPITGGREAVEQAGPRVRRDAVATQNYFQARYAIRHWWTGPIKCKNPQRGVWGGPPDGGYDQIDRREQDSRSRRAASSQLARGDQARPVGDRLQEGAVRHPKAAPPAQGKAMFFGGGLFGLALLGLGALILRRRRR